MTFRTLLFSSLLTLPMVGSGADRGAPTLESHSSCRGAAVMVTSATGIEKASRPAAGKASTLSANLSSPSFAWYCDADERKQTCPAGTASVDMSWDGSTIEWKCYAKPV